MYHNVLNKNEGEYKKGFNGCFKICKFHGHVFIMYFQVKILVPNSTAGMIIGKAGNYIKQIKEESGAYVQISQKSKETNLPERCITVAGE